MTKKVEKKACIWFCVDVFVFLKKKGGDEMILEAMVQSVEKPREVRDKNGLMHTYLTCNVVDVGTRRISGAALALAAERERDPDFYGALLALKPDDRITVDVDGIRFSGGVYRISGSVRAGVKK